MKGLADQMAVYAAYHRDATNKAEPDAESRH